MTITFKKAGLLLGTGVLAGAFVLAGYDMYQNRDTPLPPGAEPLRDEIYNRLLAGAEVTRTEKNAQCSAHYLAIHQHVEGKRRDTFRAEALLSGMSQEEIERSISPASAYDTRYSFYVMFACNQRQKPMPFIEYRNLMSKQNPYLPS